MGECPCLIPDENDKCADCGKHIDLLDAGPPPDLGDITGIIRLIQNTACGFASLVAGNVDPCNPALPRLRLIGGQFVRIPHKIVLRALVASSYKEAKGLGYRGTFERWADLVREDAPAQP
jgi:hypothetical protein